MMARNGVVMAAGMLALAGCGSPKDATKPNFAKALDKHFASHCLYVTPSVGLTTYPAAIDAGTDTSRFDALTAAGLLAAASAAAEHPGPLGIGSVRSVTKTYNLTDAGRAVFQPSTGGFCAGHYTVKSVESFTAPTPQDGRTVVQVQYTVTPHLDDWTTNGAVQDRYGAQLGSVHETSDHATLVQLDDGWAVQGD